jgi:hypothetical protein
MSKTVFKGEYAGEGADHQLAFFVDFEVCGQGLSSFPLARVLFIGVLCLLFEFRREVGQSWAYKSFSQHNRFDGWEQVIEGFRFDDVTVSTGVNCGA